MPVLDYYIHLGVVAWGIGQDGTVNMPSMIMLSLLLNVKFFLPRGSNLHAAR